MIVGIDLGTSNSLIAVFRGGEAQLVPNALGSPLTPSAVYMDEDGTIVVGAAARDRAITHPHRTALAFKRAMGTNRTYLLGRRSFRAEELSALVLGALGDPSLQQPLQRGDRAPRAARDRTRAVGAVGVPGSRRSRHAARFQALRSEYESALATARLGASWQRVTAAEPAIELLLGRCFLQDTMLSAAALAQIARRYRWDDSLSRFPLGAAVVAKYRPAYTTTSRPGAQYIGQWNWGAFCLAPFWLMAHGRRMRGALLLAAGLITCLLPVIGAAIVISWAYKLGKNGNSIAVTQRDFYDDEHFVAVQTAWRNWGIPIFAGTWLLIIGWFSYRIAGGH